VIGFQNSGSPAGKTRNIFPMSFWRNPWISPTTRIPGVRAGNTRHSRKPSISYAQRRKESPGSDWEVPSRWFSSSTSETQSLQNPQHNRGGPGGAGAFSSPSPGDRPGSKARRPRLVSINDGAIRRHITLNMPTSRTRTRNGASGTAGSKRPFLRNTVWRPYLVFLGKRSPNA